jgi:DNA-directed RNA polymerase subunit RPC12/RpoP
MALIVCVDCSKEFSDLAKNCPNCGRPRVAAVTEPIQKNNYGYGFVVYLSVFILGLLLLDFGWKISGSILSLSGAVGLIAILLRVIYKVLQKV